MSDDISKLIEAANERAENVNVEAFRNTGMVLGQKAGYVAVEAVSQVGGVAAGTVVGAVGHPAIRGIGRFVGNGASRLVSKAKDTDTKDSIKSGAAKIGSAVSRITKPIVENEHLKGIAKAIGDDINRITVDFEVMNGGQPIVETCTDCGEEDAHCMCPDRDGEYLSGQSGDNR